MNTTADRARREAMAAAIAAALLAIAELAMPDSYFADDSRCRLARAVLTGSGHPAEEKYTR